MRSNGSKITKPYTNMNRNNTSSTNAVRRCLTSTLPFTLARLISACRLHYHHLTHGVNRRRKGLSSSPRNSPHIRHASLSIDSTGSRSMTPDVIQLELPNLVIPSNASLLPRPQQPLPFPSQVRLPLKPSIEPYQLTAQQMVSFPQATYNAMPPAAFHTGHIPNELDLTRLHSVYDQHKSTFWAAITEYGVPTSPVSMVRA